MKRLDLTMLALAAAASLAVVLHGAEAATPAARRPAIVTTASSPLGSILVDGRGRTLYLFEKDTRGRSACVGSCTAYWPPLLAQGRPRSHGGARQSLLGVTRRRDGRSQVTYAGHPLYRFVQDVKPGQTGGQDLYVFGARWYVVSPAGTKVDQDDG